MTLPLKSDEAHVPVVHVFQREIEIRRLRVGGTGRSRGDGVVAVKRPLERHGHRQQRERQRAHPGDSPLRIRIVVIVAPL